MNLDNFSNAFNNLIIYYFYIIRFPYIFFIVEILNYIKNILLFNDTAENIKCIKLALLGADNFSMLIYLNLGVSIQNSSLKLLYEQCVFNYYNNNINIESYNFKLTPKISFLIGNNDENNDNKYLIINLLILKYLLSLFSFYKPAKYHLPLTQKKVDYIFNDILESSFHKTVLNLKYQISCANNLDISLTTNLHLIFLRIYGMRCVTYNKNTTEYIVDFSQWENYEVEYPDVHYKYGGKLIININDSRKTNITYLNKTYYQNDNDFKLISNILCSTALVHIVGIQHALYEHMYNSAIFSFHLKQLPLTHVLRKLTHVFTLDSVGLNRKAVDTVFSNHGLIGQSTALPKSTWNKVFDDYTENYIFEDIESHFNKCGFIKNDKNFYFANDAIEIFLCLVNYCKAILTITYINDTNLKKDIHINNFINELKNNIPYKIEESLLNITIHDLSRLIATFMYNVSFSHNQTTQTGCLLGSCLGLIVRKDTIYSNIQEFLYLINGHLGTNYHNSTTLAGNLSIIWCNDNQKYTKEVFKLQNELSIIGENIINRYINMGNLYMGDYTHIHQYVFVSTNT